MTIYELDEILTLKDWDKICEEIEKRGFRRIDQVEKKKIGFWKLCEKSAYHKSALQKDEPTDKEYYGTLYQQNKKYKGKSFISLALFIIRRDRNNVSVPRKVLLFTDLPRQINRWKKLKLINIKKDQSE